MRVFKAWRYKCDFCGKNVRQRRSMERHEIRCTANPNRQCQFHKYVTKEPQPTVAEMVAVLQEHCNDGDYGLKALREYVFDCLPCILTALRASGLCKGYEDGEFRLESNGEPSFDRRPKASVRHYSHLEIGSHNPLFQKGGPRPSLCPRHPTGYLQQQ